MKTTRKAPVKPAKDLQDSPRDKEQLKNEKATIDLPDVDDIPGQEHVRPMPPGEMADVTVSSADEEGNDILDTDEDRVMDRSGTNVSAEERELLRESSESTGTEDDIKLRQAQVDKRDEDGELLNEGVNVSGSDLDVAGSEADDDDEELGEEDEENNAYSLGGDKDDQNNGNQ